MWPFSKKWSAPEPQLGMLLGLGTEQLPPLVMLANPAGADGAVAGVAGPADGKPTAANMTGPILEGEYIAISPGEGACGMKVDRPDPEGHELKLPDEMLEESGLTPEMLDKFNKPLWRVGLELVSPGNNSLETVVFITQLARRLAALAEGIVLDRFAMRFFGPAGWVIENPLPEFDVREHVQIHIVPDLQWVHTHGMIKFGRPELEIYGVPEELSEAAHITLLNIGQYAITSALIQPGQTAGDPTQPFWAREGKKNQDHWENIPVLELVDVDEKGKPVSSGATKALRFTDASGE